jgi:hypothetical protein
MAHSIATADAGLPEGLMVYVQLSAEKEGGRGEIVALDVNGRNLTTDRLRSIPVAHIETLANTNTEFRPHINGGPQNPMSKLHSAFRQQANPQLIAKAGRRKPRKPLTRPDGSNPDAFYRQVAEAYRDAVKDTNKVAKVLAEESGVPVGTVHRWILETRRPGFLPPARQWRAG